MAPLYETDREETLVAQALATSSEGKDVVSKHVRDRAGRE